MSANEHLSKQQFGEGSTLVWSSDNRCEHRETYPDGCCDEPGHGGGRVERCVQCGVEV